MSVIVSVSTKLQMIVKAGAMSSRFHVKKFEILA